MPTSDSDTTSEAETTKKYPVEYLHNTRCRHLRYTDTAETGLPKILRLFFARERVIQLGPAAFHDRIHGTCRCDASAGRELRLS